MKYDFKKWDKETQNENVIKNLYTVVNKYHE